MNYRTVSLDFLFENCTTLHFFLFLSPLWPLIFHVSGMFKSQFARYQFYLIERNFHLFLTFFVTVRYDMPLLNSSKHIRKFIRSMYRWRNPESVLLFSWNFWFQSLETDPLIWKLRKFYILQLRSKRIILCMMLTKKYIQKYTIQFLDLANGI